MKKIKTIKEKFKDLCVTLENCPLLAQPHVFKGILKGMKEIDKELAKKFINFRINMRV